MLWLIGVFLYSVTEQYLNPDRINISSMCILLMSDTFQSRLCRSVKVCTSCKGLLYAVD